MKVPKTKERYNGEQFANDKIQFPAEGRIWPLVLHAAVKETRKSASSLVLPEGQKCEKELEALCWLGDYQAKLLGEVMVAKRLSKENLVAILKKLHDGKPPFIVSTWSTSGYRQILTNYHADADQETVNYYEADPTEPEVKNAKLDEVLSGKGTKYILYPKRMDS